MNNQEKYFWENYKKEAFEGVEFLLEKSNKFAAAKLILIAIENFGSFRLGRGTQDNKNKVLPGGGGRTTAQAIRLGYEVQKNKEAFNCFLKEYIKDFNEKIFEQKDKLWRSFRNGLIHDGMIKNNHQISLAGPLIKIQDDKIILNIKKLFKLIKEKSLPKFDQELDDFVLRRWRERYKFLK